MLKDFQVEIKALEKLKVSFEDMPDKVQTAAVLAINTTIRRARTEAGRHVRAQVNFPSRYLTGSAGKLQIGKFAKTDDPEAILTGRRRPTSLARFATSRATRRGPVTVSVKPGSSVKMARTFLMPLRSGNSDTLGNLGLAVRTSGGRPRGTSRGKEIGKNLYLLYGPSVAQALLNVQGTGIYGDISDDMLDFFEKEFARQTERLMA